MNILLDFVTIIFGSVYLLSFGFIATRLWSMAYFTSKLEYQDAFFSNLNKRPNQETPHNGT